MIYAITILLLAIAYRIRGGGWITFPSSFYARLVWCVALGGAIYASTWLYWAALMMLPLGYLSLMIPHAKWQNMGHTPTATFQDCWLGMMGVGIARGLIIFIPLAFVNPNFVYGAIAMMWLQPTVYALGWITPSWIKGLANGAEWAEFYNGAAWGIAIVAAG